MDGDKNTTKVTIPGEGSVRSDTLHAMLAEAQFLTPDPLQRTYWSSYGHPF